ncbi:hypothetical protein, partial [Streptacidiphilus neutrinimicus]|uniref:hypothetical protein n=1 Tax=Streptacidiphilus neutrinimicus TaxID=105420 RepID=UPI0005A719FC
DDHGLQVLAALQRSATEARRLIDDCPDPEWRGSAAGMKAELPVLMGEGRYREAATVAESLAQAPGVSAAERMGAWLQLARALAYAMESTPAGPGERERFLELCRELRDAPPQLTSGSDLRSLYYQITGDAELAVDEARTAARVGSAPLRRSMAYCTLAMALMGAGRREQAQKALRLAMSQGSDNARIAFVAAVVVPDGRSTPVSAVGS